MSKYFLEFHKKWANLNVMGLKNERILADVVQIINFTSHYRWKNALFFLMFLMKDWENSMPENSVWHSQKNLYIPSEFSDKGQLQANVSARFRAENLHQIFMLWLKVLAIFTLPTWQWVQSCRINSIFLHQLLTKSQFLYTYVNPYK